MKRYFLESIFFCLCPLLFVACSTTSQDRYKQLAGKSALECVPSLEALAKMPAEELAREKDVDGELDADHCLTLADGSRSSYEVYAFTATANSHSLEIITFIKPRGLGFGGENTIAVPRLTVFQDGSRQGAIVQRTQVQWIKNFVEGSMLKSTFLLGSLTARERYRLIVTTDNRNLGKEIPGYFSTAAAGIVVIGPFGKTKLTLK